MMTNEDKIIVYMMDTNIFFHFGHMAGRLEPLVLGSNLDGFTHEVTP